MPPTVQTTCMRGDAKTPNGAMWSCYDWYSRTDFKSDGIYSINPAGIEGQSFYAYCDMTNGGWTVLQR